MALFPLAITYVAVDRYAQNRMTYRQTIATLSHLTEHGGYTPAGHAERVADLSVRIGRVLGISDRDLRDVEYAALLHDLGQISLIEPIPGGATVLAAPSDQRDIADEGARIIRHAEGLETVADYVEAQTTPYRQVRELGRGGADRQPDHQGGQRLRRPHRRPRRPGRDPGGQRAHPPRPGLRVRPRRGRGAGRRDVGHARSAGSRSASRPSR